MYIIDISIDATADYATEYGDIVTVLLEAGTEFAITAQSGVRDGVRWDVLDEWYRILAMDANIYYIHIRNINNCCSRI